jgi:hypothetical protein
MKSYLKYAASFWVSAFLVAGSMPSRHSGGKERVKTPAADSLVKAEE